MVFSALTVVLTLFLLAISIVDLRSFRIPDLLSLPLGLLGLIAASIWHPGSVHNQFIGAVAGFALLAAIGAWAFHRSGVDALGLGDAKLFGAAGAWLGWQALPMVLLMASVGGIAFVLLRGRGRLHEAVAFGPFLAVGFWAVWVWQHIGVPLR